MQSLPEKKSKGAIVAWCIYDWAISAFPVIIITFIFATYFTQKIAANNIIGTHQWGNAISLAGLMIAIFSPIFGSIADYRGHHKNWLGFFTFFVILSSTLLWYAKPEINNVNYTLTWVVIGYIGVEISMVFYNTMLTYIAPKDYLGRISGWSWGLGYFGGLAALIIALYGFVEAQPHWLNSVVAEHIRICGPFTALWVLVFAVPLFLFVPNISTKQFSTYQSIKRGLTDLGNTLKTLPQQKNLFCYLIAHMIYIDGLNTVFAFGGIYAAGTFGMSMTQVIMFGIILNIAAGIGSIALAWMDDYVGSKATILLSLACLTILGISLVLIHSKLLFWILASCLCLFVGSVQSASRSLMARLIPPEKATEFFGLYTFSGKVTTFIGPWLFGFVTYYFNSQRAGMAAVMLFFIIGALLLKFVKEPKTSS